MTLKRLLIKIWQQRSFEVEEMLFLLGHADIDTLAEVLTSLSKREISVNEAEEEIKNASASTGKRKKVCC